MKMLLSSCLALCASVVSAESFASADAHAQLRGAVDGARVIAQAPAPGTAIRPLPPVAEAHMLGEWEVIRFETVKHGARLLVDYTDPAEARGEIHRKGEPAPSPFAVRYTARATHSYSITEGRRVFRQTAVKTDSVGGSRVLLMPYADAEALWDVQPGIVVYSDFSAALLQAYEARLTGPDTLELRSWSADGGSVAVRLGRRAPNP